MYYSNCLKKRQHSLLFFTVLYLLQATSAYAGRTTKFPPGRGMWKVAYNNQVLLELVESSGILLKPDKLRGWNNIGDIFLGSARLTEDERHDLSNNHHKLYKSCRERYLYHLSPGIDNSDATDHEIEIVRLFVITNGKKWTEIATILPGRSPNWIKNTYNWYIDANRRKPNQAEADVITERAREDGLVADEEAGNEEDIRNEEGDFGALVELGSQVYEEYSRRDANEHRRTSSRAKR